MLSYKADPYAGAIRTSVSYPSAKRQKCDLIISKSPGWAIEVKMLRLLGDNGKPNGNAVKYILSPYPTHRSALTDCSKLNDSQFAERKAVLIFGYEVPKLPLLDMIMAFEILADQKVVLGKRHAAYFDQLIHPVHTSGAVYAWEIEGIRSG